MFGFRHAPLVLLALVLSLSPSAVAQEVIQIDAQAQTTPFPHFWEQMFGSGRAVLALRAAYLNDLNEVKHATDFRYVRGHAILHDEVIGQRDANSGRIASIEPVKQHDGSNTRSVCLPK